MNTKVCTKCNEERDLNLYVKSEKGKLGLSSQCKICDKFRRSLTSELNREYLKEYYLENKEKLLAKNKEYRKENFSKIQIKKQEYYRENLEKILEYRELNKERILEIQRRTSAKYREIHREDIREYYREYYLKNIDKMRSTLRVSSARRRAKLLQRTPEWLTEEDFAAIERFYTEAKRLESETGTKHHVDHIVPLLGKTVCGLHVPWNLQVLTAYENLTKSNKFTHDYYESNLIIKE